MVSDRFQTVGLIVLALLVLNACAPQAPDTGSSAGPSGALETDAWEDEIVEMVSALGLSFGEEDAVRAAYEARVAEVRAFFESDEGRQLEADEAALKEAVESGDLSAVQQITARASIQRATLSRIVERGAERIRESLPEDRRLEWDGYRIAAALLEVMLPLSLDFDQRSQIELQAPACVDAARLKGELNPLAAGYVLLERWAEDNVLTPEQKSAFVPLKKQNALQSLQF